VQVRFTMQERERERERVGCVCRVFVGGASKPSYFSILV
jgi:hypothetical protein